MNYGSKRKQDNTKITYPKSKKKKKKFTLCFKFYRRKRIKRKIIHSMALLINPYTIYLILI